MKSTKKSLLLSTLSLIMCVAMLLGTTYAWFTDSVTSGKNIIKAGNLDVELVSAKKGTVDTNTKLFADVSKWEPGVAVYDTLTVKNVGNLALKYQMNLIFDNETKVGGRGLSEVLKVGTYSGTITNETKREDVISAVTDWTSLVSFVKSGNLAANTDATPVTYVIYWEPGDNDNLYNMNNDNKDKTLSIDFYVELVATQDTVEADSFDKLYDEKAFLPVISTAAVADAGNTVVKDETNDITVTAPEGSLPAGVTTLKLYVEEAAKPANIVVASSQKSITAEVTLKDQNGNKITANGTTLFTATMNVGTNRDNLKVYHSGTEMTKVVAPDVPNADNEYSYDSASGIVTMTITNFSPFTSVYDKDSWASHADEVEVGDITIATAEQLAGFAKNVNAGKSYAGKTVTLGADIDLGAYLWKPMSWFEGTIDGQNHTIKNLLVADYTGTYAGFISVVSGATIKNLKFTNAEVYNAESNGGGRGGIIVGWSYACLIDNCHVENAKISGGQKVGGILGCMSVESSTSLNQITNCSVKNLTLSANDGGSIYQSGGLLGYIQLINANPNGVLIENNSVENITFNNDSPDYGNIGYYNGTFIGTIVNKQKVDGQKIILNNNTVSGTNTAVFAPSKYTSTYFGWVENADHYTSGPLAPIVIDGVTWTPAE